MKRCIVPALLFVLAACNQVTLETQTPSAGFTPQTFGSSGNDAGTSVTVQTSQGVVYAAGRTSGSLDGTNQGEFDAFVRRYDREGALVWGRQFGTSENDDAESVAADSSANVYVVGTTNGSLAGSRGREDAFIRKYNKSGSVLWTRQFGSSEADFGIGVATDSSGNAYVLGSTYSNLAPTNSGTDGFLRKYDPGGTVVWTRRFAIGNGTEPEGVAIDGGGAVYVGGETVAPNGKGFIRKFTNSGRTVWTRIIDSGASVYVYDIAAKGSYIYITGFSDGTLAAAKPGGSAFIAPYNTGGMNLWTRQFGSGVNDYAYGVGIDSDGNAYVTGQTSRRTPGMGAIDDDIFSRKYTSSGSVGWIKLFGSSASDSASDIATFSSSETYIIGVTDGAIATTNKGDSDAFLRRINNVNGNPVWTDQ